MHKDIQLIEVDGKNRIVCQGECGSPIPDYDMVPEGYDSPEVWEVDTSGGTTIVRKVLCKECYLTAFSRQYPELELPQL